MTIVMNDGGPAFTAPPGGYDPVIGTNPIAFGIPTEGKPLVVDMATSKRAWAQVMLADKYGTDLPENAYYDNQGKVTVNPKAVHAAMPFGDYKGFALVLMIEVLCGSLIGMNNMMAVDDNTNVELGVTLNDRGAFILVIDPRQTSDLDEFKKANTELTRKIKTTHSLRGQEIRIPGEQVSQLQSSHIAEDLLNVPEELWQEIQAM